MGRYPIDSEYTDKTFVFSIIKLYVCVHMLAVLIVPIMIILDIGSRTRTDMQSEIEMLRQQVAELNDTIDRIKDQDIEVYSAARALVERWDTPLWKDAPATAEYINRLRKAIEIERKLENP